MPITGIKYRFLIISPFSDFETTAQIPFTGDDRVMTSCKRSSSDTEITRYELTDEIINNFLALIEKYNITDWIGKPPAPPKIIGEGTGTLSEITLLFDDGTDSRITFREVPEDIGNSASEEFRKLFFASSSDERKISGEVLYPTLKECIKFKEEHGPVSAVETVSFSSGMMYGSNQTVKKNIKKIPEKENTVLVTVEKQAGNLPSVSDSKEINSDIFARLQELSDKENIPVWNYACTDPSIPVDTSMIPTDCSRSFNVNVFYDDSLITGCPSVKRTIGEKACSMGGEEVSSTITGMVNECVDLSGIDIAMPTPNMRPEPADISATAVPNGFMGMLSIFGKPGPSGSISASASDESGTWTCKECGKTGLTTKYCSECGYPRQ